MLRKSTLVWLTLIIFFFGTTPSTAKPGTASALPKTPFGFIENKGQLIDQYGNPRSDIDFKLSSDGVLTFIGKGQVHYQWMRPLTTDEQAVVSFRSAEAQEPVKIESYRMDVRLLGANPNASVVSEKIQNYYERYYLPGCGSDGVRARSYQKITYKAVYPGIDWVLYIRNGKLEYDFIIHPGGNIADIAIEYQGTTSLHVNAKGQLVATTPYGEVIESAPYSFQQDGKEIASRFVLAHDTLRFETDTYQGVLTIDPSISWATYYGGGQGFADEINDIALDNFGSLFIVGNTSSTSNIATTGGHQISFQGGYGDAFLAKFNRNGNATWATYYGGTGNEKGWSVDCDSVGNVYISGSTNSTSNIATTGSHQELKGGSAFSVFFVKFDSSGSRQWGSYYGGSSINSSLSIPYNNLLVQGNFLYIAGSTTDSNGIATSGSYQPSYGGGSLDAFLTKLTLDGIREWGTYFGGTEDDGIVIDLALDKEGNVYLSGSTGSEDGIATAGSHQVTYGGGDWDHFLAKFNDDGSLLWSTYYGGEDDEMPNRPSRRVACDESGNIYITGSTKSATGIATQGSYQSTYAGGSSSGYGDAYLAKFDSTGLFQWGTYFGGNEEDIGYSINKSIRHESVLISGETRSTSGIASTNALQTAFAGGTSTFGDAFIARFDNTGQLLYSSYYGGIGIDAGWSIIEDAEDYAYLAGITNSTSLGTPGSHQSNFPGNLLYGMFLTKFCFGANLSTFDLSGPDTICRNSQEQYAIVPPIEDAEAYIWTLPSAWLGASDSSSIIVNVESSGGELGVQVVRCNDTSSIIVKPVYVRPPSPPEITVDERVLGTVRSYSNYQWCLNGLLINGANASTYTVTENGDYTVITTDSLGCVDTSMVYTVDNVDIRQAPSIIAQIRTYPNPAQETLFIESPIPVSLVIQNMAGKHLLVAPIGMREIRIDALSAGIYLLKINDQQGRVLKTEKLIKIQP